MGYLYLFFALIAIVGIISDPPFDLAHALANIGAILEFFFICSTALIFLRCARRLHRGERRWFRPALWTIAVNLVWIAVIIGGLLWITFSGTVDPGVPFLNMLVVICLALFVLLALGPLLYYLIQAHREQKLAS